MDFLWDGFRSAIELIFSGDAQTWNAAWITLLCSLTATTLAAVVAVPYGAWLALYRPRGARLQAQLLRIGMFVPTIFIGVLVFGFITRRGPLGALDLYATRTAIIIGEFLLAFPILGTFAHGALAKRSRRAFETARTLGASRARTLLTLIGEVRVVVVAAYLMAAARCFSELGISLTVGGSVRWETETLSAKAAVSVSKGDFSQALALGIVLMVLAVGVALLAHVLSREDGS